MTLSKQTLDHLLEAEGSMRAAIKSAAVNEKPVVVKQFAEILVKLEQTKKIDEIIDMIENREEDLAVCLAICLTTKTIDFR